MTKLLAYRNASFASPSGGLTQAAMQPEWFATIGGKPATSSNFSNQWFADVGHPGYQQAWLDAVLRDCAGFDGIALDDVNMDQDWHLGGRVLDKYPTRDAWQRAMDDFVYIVGRKLKAAGILAMPNIYIRDFWKEEAKLIYLRWVADCSGALKEHYTKWGEAASDWHTGDGFDQFQDLFARSQKVGRIINVTTAPKDDVRSQTYARAAFLLEWVPGSGAALAFSPAPEAQAPWTETWTADLGLPTQPKYAIQNGYARFFDKGYVTLDKVNATAQIVRVSRTRWREAGGEVSGAAVS